MDALTRLRSHERIVVGLRPVGGFTVGHVVDRRSVRRESRFRIRCDVGEVFAVRSAAVAVLYG